MTAERILIRNAQLANGSHASIRIADGVVEHLETSSEAAHPSAHSDETVVDAAGAMCLPAAVDLSVRLRQPGPASPASIASELASALAGGVGTVCVPPDSTPVVNDPAVVEWIDRRARAVAVNGSGARAVLLGALTEDLGGTHVNDLQALIDAGCVGVAQSNGVPEDLAAFRRALIYAAGFGVTVHVRPTIPSLDGGVGIANSALAIRLGLPTQPALAEVIAVSTLLELARDTGVRMHIGRLSAARSVALIREAKAEGLTVTADVAIANLLLDVSAAETLDPRYHLSPPLRSSADQAALSAGAADGTIDAICSDHQPHDAEAKNAPFPLAATGGAGVHQLWPAALAWGSQHGVGIKRLSELLASNPASILGLSQADAAAEFSVGCAANFCLISDRAEPARAASNSEPARLRGPLSGNDFDHRVTRMWLAGREVLAS